MTKNSSPQQEKSTPSRKRKHVDLEQRDLQQEFDVTTNNREEQQTFASPAKTPEMKQKIKDFQTRLKSRRIMPRKSKADKIAEDGKTPSELDSDEEQFEEESTNNQETQQDEYKIFAENWRNVLGPRRELTEEQYDAVIGILKYSDPYSLSEAELQDFNDNMFIMKNLISEGTAARICFRVKASAKVKLQKKAKEETKHKLWHDEVDIVKRLYTLTRDLELPLQIRSSPSTLLDDIYSVVRFMDQARITLFMDRLFFVRQRLPYHAATNYDELLEAIENLENENQESLLVETVMEAVTPQVEYEEYLAEFLAIKPRKKEKIFEYYSRFSALKKFFNIGDKVAINIYAKSIPSVFKKNIKSYKNNNPNASFDTVIGKHISEFEDIAFTHSYKSASKFDEYQQSDSNYSSHDDEPIKKKKKVYSEVTSNVVKKVEPPVKKDFYDPIAPRKKSKDFKGPSPSNK